MTAPVIVTGSIATDHLMTFPGRFAEQILPDKVAAISLSFLVDDLTVRRGGVAANIAYGVGRMGGAPVLVGAAGRDFDESYRGWLVQNGVNCGHVRLSGSAYTARFVCTTDLDMCQIASFYPGAMAEASLIDLEDVVGAVGEPGLVLIGPDTPAAMIRHAEACRRRGWRFAADPSQQLATMTGDQCIDFVSGAALLLTNEYECELLLARTGLDRVELSRLVGASVTTLGADGVRITAGDESTVIPAAPVAEVVDPTGGGDAFRAGLVVALGWELPLTVAARVGCQLAALALRSAGAQSYEPRLEELHTLLSRSYGAEVADLVRRSSDRAVSSSVPT